MNPAVKATGAAAGIAAALVDIASWLAKTYLGVELPDNIGTDFAFLLTFALGYLIHSP